MSSLPKNDSILQQALNQATSAFTCQDAFLASEKPRVRDTITPCGINDIAYDVAMALDAIAGIAVCIQEDHDGPQKPSKHAANAFDGMRLLAAYAAPGADAVAQFVDQMTTAARNGGKDA